MSDRRDLREEPDGSPHLTAMWYLLEGDEILFEWPLWRWPFRGECGQRVDA